MGIAGLRKPVTWGSVSASREPEPGTCEDPFELNAIGIVQGSTAADQADAQVYNYARGTCGGRDGFEHVYRFAPNLADGEVQQFCLTTLGSDIDTVLYTRTGPCNDGATELGCNDDNRGVNGEAGTSALTLRAAAGESYYIFVDGWSDADRGDYNLELRLGSCEGGN